MTDKESFQFIDTNVLIYAHDFSAGLKHIRASQLLEELWGNHRGCLSVQVMQEFFVNITRKVAKPLSSDVAAQHIADLGNWRVHLAEVQDVLGAIEIQKRNQLSFWDAMIVRSAVQLDCALIWSEDLNPGQIYEGVQVVNPFI